MGPIQLTSSDKDYAGKQILRTLARSFGHNAPRGPYPLGCLVLQTLEKLAWSAYYKECPENAIGREKNQIINSFHMKTYKEIPVLENNIKTNINQKLLKEVYTAIFKMHNQQAPTV